MTAQKSNTHERLNLICWALYDTGNQFFFLNVMTLYFPRWLTETKNVPIYYYGITFTLSMIIVSLSAPFLGAISDIQKRKKIYLTLCTILAVLFTYLVGRTDNVVLSLLFFSFANIACQIAVAFYNAMIHYVTKGERYGLVSGIGKMFGYGGALIAMVASKYVIGKYGYAVMIQATAGAFLLFSLPLIIVVPELKENEKNDDDLIVIIKEAVKRVKKTCSRATEFKKVRVFLYMFASLMCVVQTVALFLAVYAGKIFELNEQVIINLIILSTVCAVFGSLIAGKACDKYGGKKMMVFVLMLWTLVLVSGLFAKVPFHWLIGALTGFALSGTWVIGRMWLVKISPEEKKGEMFALFTIASYVGGIIGPLASSLFLIVLSDVTTYSYRMSLFFLILFIYMSFYFLKKIKTY